MELKILSDKENRLLSRREISFEVAQDKGTMKREELSKELCKRLNLDPDSTVIIRINQGFGTRESSGTAHSYKSKELLEKYESKKVLSKGKGEQKQGQKSEAKEQKEEKKEQ